jgi:hypothetical protein
MHRLITVQNKFVVFTFILHVLGMVVDVGKKEELVIGNRIK